MSDTPTHHQAEGFQAEILATKNPIALFKDWLAQAHSTESIDPNAISLATVDSQGLPNARMVLLKDITTEAFVFYTNYGSAKAAELDYAKKAAFVVHWKTQKRQIRVRGLVGKQDNERADAYFYSRHPQSQIGAWASQQSAPLKNRRELEDRVAELTAKFGDSPPRPPFWGGYCLYPLAVEFWQDGKDRLHDRFLFERATLNADWAITRLNP